MNDTLRLTRAEKRIEELVGRVETLTKTVGRINELLAEHQLLGPMPDRHEVYASAGRNGNGLANGSNGSSRERVAAAQTLPTTPASAMPLGGGFASDH